MILSGLKIKEEIENGNIEISPFNEKQLNPNSYNLCLGNEILVYDNEILDAKEDNPYSIIEIPEEGLLLRKGNFCLARTMEYTKTDKYIPMLEGRSSTGRLGLCIHATAGFGDVGFSGYWTLELYPMKSVIVYPGMELCQIYYHTILGDYVPYKEGKYQNNTGIQPSLMYKDFQGENK